MKLLMTGNEAIARGAYEAGVRFASAYPGTPSTEILENVAIYKEDISQVSRFLNGNNKELLDLLKNKMEQYSINLQFEKALEYRDIINNIETSILKSQTGSAGNVPALTAFPIASRIACLIC